MSDALENKAVEILDASQKAMGAFADKLGELAKQYGPEVAEAALQMARIDAINTLVPGLITAPIGFFAYRKIMAHVAATKAKNPENFDIFDCEIFILAPLSIVIFIASLISIESLVNVWAWVGIFEPKLWLAKRILGL